MKSIRFLWMPTIAVSLALLALWYIHLPAPIVTSNMAQVELEAKNGGYRLINVEVLSKLYLADREKVLLVDTRQEWEHRAGHIAGSRPAHPHIATLHAQLCFLEMHQRRRGPEFKP